MRNYLLLISFLISAGMVNAQDSVNSGGGTALSSAGFASFSIGQPFFVSQISATGAVYPGIQQGYEISSEDGLNIYPSVSVKAYPNPVTDYLILSFSSFDLYGIKVILTDSKGVFLRLSEIVEAESRIDMASLSAGVYFLKVLKDNRLLKTFKILKK